MSHEILGERFRARQADAAWHRLGLYRPNSDAGAVEALGEIGEPVYTLEKVPPIVMPGGVTIEVPHRGIVRHPVPEDDRYLLLNVVGGDYRLLVPSRIARAYDQALPNRPVETIGFLELGALFFLTTALPSIDVFGDPVEMYLLGACPMDGGALRLSETPIRVVCRNTCSLAEARATDTFRIPHDEHAEERLGSWLAVKYEEARANVEILKGAFELLAAHRPMVDEVQKVLLAAYPIPPEPRRDAPEDVLRIRFDRWSADKTRVARYRDAAIRLWDGEGTGMDARATRGTTWGLWQAVVELEDKRPGWTKGGPAQEAMHVARSSLLGPRADTKARAFEAAMAVAGAS